MSGVDRNVIVSELVVGYCIKVGESRSYPIFNHVPILEHLLDVVVDTANLVVRPTRVRALAL